MGNQYSLFASVSNHSLYDGLIRITEVNFSFKCMEVDSLNGKVILQSAILKNPLGDLPSGTAADIVDIYKDGTVHLRDHNGNIEHEARVEI